MVAFMSSKFMSSFVLSVCVICLLFLPFVSVAVAKQVKKNWPDAILVFLEPPSWEELVSRLEGRATDSPERRAQRLTLAQEEMAQSPFFDHILVNDQVEHVVASLIRLAHSQRS